MPQEGRKPGWPQGSRKLGRARDRSSFYLEVYRLDIIPSGIMAQVESTRMYFIRGSGEDYIDLAACLTAVNRKQYHQVAGDGTPLCYRVTLHTAGRGQSLAVYAAQKNWTTRNAVKMTSAGWKKQLKHGGVKMSDLPRYGRRIRLALEDAATVAETRNSVTQQTITKQLEPLNGDGSKVFTAYTDTAGTSVDYDWANPVTLVPVSNHTTGAIVDYPLLLCTDIGTDDFNVNEEYLEARRNVSDLETDAPGPVATNKMTTLFSTAEELSDDIIAAVDDFGDNRPYDETNHALQFLGKFGAETDAASSSDQSSHWPPAFMSADVPLGLLKVTGAENDQFIIEVHAIYEM